MSFVFNNWKSLLRLWNGLSRLQRNLLTLVTSLLVFGFVCYVVLNPQTRSRASDISGRSDLSNLGKLINDRLRHDPGGAGKGPLLANKSKSVNLPDLTNIDIPAAAAESPRNRIEAVHNALEGGEDEEGGNGLRQQQKRGGGGGGSDAAAANNNQDLEFDAGQVVDKNEDKAVENNDFDNYEGAAAAPAADGDKSNVADEDTGDGDDDEDYGAAAAAAAAAAALPPKDGSLKFSGPANERQKAVVDAFKFAWTNYRRFSWGEDHLRPISKTGQNWFGLGLTIVDSLDTMLIMNLREEFAEARDWVRDKLNFSLNKDVNLFETTIRVLGGLLSAFHLSEEQVFLDKATDLADRLMGAFRTSSGIPYSDVNLMESRGHSPKWSPDSSTSEVTTIQLEFRDLSRCTNDDKYEKAVEGISKRVHALEKPANGLVPIYINPNTGNFRKGSTITLGARGDSYYEYLLKQWVQTGKSQDYLKMDFLESMQGVSQRLVKRTLPNRLVFVGELITSRTFKPKMDELVCFLPGTLALAAHHGLTSSDPLPPIKEGDDDVIAKNSNMLMQLAEELAYTCYLTFARQPTFLAPEITHFNHDEQQSRKSSSDDFYVKPADSHYLLRPETIESLYYLYYVTGNKTYQDWGWNIFQGIEKYAKVRHGYTTISNVRNPMDLRPKDMMESFFLGETLKYLYLLFADKHEIDLKRWVFNTEAHPLPVRPN